MSDAAAEPTELDAILKLTPAQVAAEHKKMMHGADNGSPAVAGKMDDHAWKERAAYRKAFEEHVGKFLSGEMTGADGKIVQHREEALAHAHLAGRKAVQALKKTGLKISVYAD